MLKSIYDNSLSAEYSKVFTKTDLEHIRKEGFKWASNDSYCAEGDKHPNECFSKRVGTKDGGPVNIYILSTGIGIDIDYSCGGNSLKFFWDFSVYTFEEAYNAMVDTLNDWDVYIE